MSETQRSKDVFPMTIVLLGKTGAGKSAAGNTIVGRGVFKKTFSVKSVTETCAKLQSEVSGRPVILIDTPGSIYTERQTDKLDNEVKKCVRLCVPGPHAFLLVIRLDVKFTEEEKNAVKWIQENFGKEASKYTIVLLTHGDVLKETKESFLRKNPALSSVIKDFGGRYHVFNNKSKERTQVRELKEKIEAMVEENGAAYYKGKWEAKRKLEAKMLERNEGWHYKGELEAKRKTEAKMVERNGGGQYKGELEAKRKILPGTGKQAKRASPGAKSKKVGFLEAILSALILVLLEAIGATIVGAVAATVGAGVAAQAGAVASVGATAVAAGAMAGAFAVGQGAIVSATRGGAVGTAAVVVAIVASVLAVVAAAWRSGAMAAAAGVALGVTVAAQTGAPAIVGSTAVAGAVVGAVEGSPLGSTSGPIVAMVVATLRTVLGAVAGAAFGMLAAAACPQKPR